MFFSSTKLPFSKSDLVSHKRVSAMYPSPNYCLNGHAVAGIAMTKQPVSSLLVSHVSPDVDSLHDSFLPQRGMCLDIAILDSAYLLSQVVPSLFMGTIVQLFSSVTAYTVCSLVLSLLAVILSSRIVFTRQEMEMLK